MSDPNTPIPRDKWDIFVEKIRADIKTQEDQEKIHPLDDYEKGFLLCLNEIINYINKNF